MRYVVEKNNRNGSLRWYWQRPGFPTKRLSDDEGERLEAATALNERADAEKRGDTGPADPVFGTIAWAVEEYKNSPKYARLSVNTRKVYDRWLLSLSETVGNRAMTALTPKAVYDILDGIDSKGGKAHCAAVLRRVADVAIRRGIMDRNPATRLDLEGSKRRKELWDKDEIDRFLVACEGERHGAAIALGFKIMLYTTQRPGDVRAMAWSAYNGDNITIRQQKTGTLVKVHCLDVLREALDEAKAKRTGTVIVAGPNGQRLTEDTWREAFNIIRRKAGLEHLQARDLRRTAVVNMARAGATVPEIAANTGHSIHRTQYILEHYLPRDAHMARAGIIKLERKK
ncbi:MAG: tyrosine-type recombinase/integrase [Alphaproteobacteria bacterium]|nr:tyrosine-type recombinase/integrase [Alphaproteobacteria bacterium]